MELVGASKRNVHVQLAIDGKNDKDKPNPAVALIKTLPGARFCKNQTDTIASRLDDLTPDANCKLRIGMKSVHDTRPKLVALVKDFRKAGCQVWMVVSTKNGHIDMDRSVYDAFIKAGVTIRSIPRLHDSSSWPTGSTAARTRPGLHRLAELDQQRPDRQRRDLRQDGPRERHHPPAVRRLPRALQRRLRQRRLLHDVPQVLLVTAGAAVRTRG